MKQIEWSFVKDLPRKARKERVRWPVDAMFTCPPEGGTLLYAMLAVDAGFQLGVRSSDVRDLASYERWPVTFVDNEWHDYDHEAHLEIVAALRPKYATTRDYVTREQAEAAGVEYFDLDRILRWADDVGQYAENVIVIPKDRVLHEIPDYHVLGYSVPSSYGGTPIPIEEFAGRRVHLLGGSWKAQREMMDILGDDVVSIDFNYIWKLSRTGGFCYPSGKLATIEEVIQAYPARAITTGLTLSLNFIANALATDYSVAPTTEE